MKTRVTTILITLLCVAMGSSFGITSAVGQVWTPTGNMSTPRYRHAGTLLLSGKVLVTGGSLYGHQCDECLHSAELYDPATRLWTATGSMNFGRYWHTATLLASGKVLVAAGNGVASGYEISAELYDPATGTWTPTGSLLDYRKQHDATLLVSGKVLVTGGPVSLRCRKQRRAV